MKSVESRLSLFTTPKIKYKTLNIRPNKNNVITVSVMNIIITLRNKTNAPLTYVHLVCNFQLHVGYVVPVSMLTTRSVENCLVVLH